MSQPKGPLWNLIQEAEDTLKEKGLDWVVREQPHVLDMAMTALLIRTLGNNGKRAKREVALEYTRIAAVAGVLIALIGAVERLVL